MQPVYVPIVVKNAGLSIEETLVEHLGGPPTLAGARYIAEQYRRMAIGFLFISGVPDDFFEHLFHSSRCFLHFLETGSDDQKATSHGAPLFDAIACGDDEGAERMARGSRRTWNATKEYEDDFLYVHFILERFFRNAGPPVLRGLLQRWEDVADGAKDARLDLCKAVFLANQAAFHVALDGLVAAIDADIEEQRDSDLLNPEAASTTALVSTELLAWLRLADSVGLRTQPGYRFAPDVARLLARARRPGPDDWRAIESYAELA